MLLASCKFQHWLIVNCCQSLNWILEISSSLFLGDMAKPSFSYCKSRCRSHLKTPNKYCNKHYWSSILSVGLTSVAVGANTDDPSYSTTYVAGNEGRWQQKESCVPSVGYYVFQSAGSIRRECHDQPIN